MAHGRKRIKVKSAKHPKHTHLRGLNRACRQAKTVWENARIASVRGQKSLRGRPNYKYNMQTCDVVHCRCFRHWLWPLNPELPFSPGSSSSALQINYKGGQNRCRVRRHGFKLA